MRSVAFGLALVAFAAVLPPTAAAEQLHANVVSWAPNDVKVGEPVSVVLELYVAGSTPHLPHGTPIAGVNEVEVVLRGNGQLRRFATADIGGGHYSTKITFPEPGGWDLRVSYGRGSHGAGEEIQLGKGGIRVDGPARGDSRRAGTAVPPAAVTLGLPLVLVAAVSGRARAASRCSSRGTPGRPG